MNKAKFNACLWALSFAFATTLWAHPADFKDLGSLLHEMEDQASQVVGAAMVIIQDDKIIYKKTFGHLEAGGKEKVDDKTLFALASVSKPIVATSLAVLQERNQLSFNDVYSFQGMPLPLVQILSHTTGYRVRGDTQIEQGMARAPMLRLLRAQKRATTKGNPPYTYSNLVYSLSQDFAASKGFDMKALVKVLPIGAQVWPLATKNVVTPHGKGKEVLARPSFYQKSVPASAGVFVSLDGMISFLRIVLGKSPTLISQKALDNLFTPRTKALDVLSWPLPMKDGGLESSYGLGWRRLDVKGRKDATLVFHSGFINGATAFVGIIPSKKMGIVILSNQTSRFPVRSGLKIWEHVMGIVHD